MRKSIQRILSLALALALVCCAIPVQADALGISSSTLIAPQYEDAGNFSGGLAAVKVDGKWGYINESGETVIEPKYDWAGSFSEGVAVVAKLEPVQQCQAYGGEIEDAYVLYLIDKSGKEIKLMNPYFDPNADYYLQNGYPDAITEGPRCYQSLEDLERASPHLWTCNDGIVRAGGVPYKKDGTPIVPVDPDENIPQTNGSYGPYNYFSQIGPAVDGVIPMRAFWQRVGGESTHCFYMDTEGNVTKVFELNTDTDYSGISAVFAPDNGLIVAYWDSDESYGWGVMDMEYNWVIEPVYSDFFLQFNGQMFFDDLLTVQDQNGFWGAINSKGEVVVPMEYDSMTTFLNGYASATKDGKACFLSTEGEVYSIGGLDGGEGSATMCSQFNSKGIAAVYDAESGTAYCVDVETDTKVFPAVEGSDKLAADVYFPDYDGENAPSYILIPSDIVTIQEDGKYGFIRLDLEYDNPFKDVNSGQFYTTPVLWAVHKGITNGMTQTTFVPNSNCTRGQIVTFLWRAMGEPEAKAQQVAFTDVKEGAYYYDAVLWAVENGITTGMTAKSFAPDDPCTRAQAMTFLWRAMGKPEAEASTSPFSDVQGDYYFQPVLWAVEEGITNGMSAKTFGTEVTCSRGHIVTFLYRCLVE